MKSTKNNLKKDSKAEKKVTYTSHRTTTSTTSNTTATHKSTLQKTDSKKNINKSQSKTSSTASTRPQTSRINEKRGTSKGPPKTKEHSKSVKIIEDPHKKFPKFMKLIEKKKLFSGINEVILKRFKHWKTLTLMQSQQITEKTHKTVVTKKKVNIRRVGHPTKEKSTIKTEKPSTTSKNEKAEDKKLKLSKSLVKTSKPEEKKSAKNLTIKKTSASSIQDDEARKIKIRKFIESRIEAYEANKCLIKRYFDIWLGRRSLSMTTKEVQKKNIVTKKRIFLVKEKSKALFDEKSKETKVGKNEKTDPLKRLGTLPVKSNISISGTKTLAEKSIQRENKSNNNLNKVLKEDIQKKYMTELSSGRGSEKKLKKEFAARDKKNQEQILIILKKIMKRPIKKYFLAWKLFKREKEKITGKTSSKIITKSKIKLKRMPQGAKEGEKELEVEEDTMQTTQGTIAEPQQSKEDGQKSKTIQTVTKETKKEIIPKGKNLKVRNLVLNISRNQLIRHFKIWREKTQKGEYGGLRAGTKKTVIKKKYINLTKKHQDKNGQEGFVEEEMPKNLNLEIPTCPISETHNYTKDVYNGTLIQYLPEDIYSIPPRESILRSNLDVNIETDETGKKKPIVKTENIFRCKFIKGLIENLNKGILIRYFNLWK